MVYSSLPNHQVNNKKIAVNILIIPSWYPSISKPGNGRFFYDQAKLLSNAGHRVKVLYPSIKKRGRKEFIKNGFRRKISIVNNCLQPPEAYKVEFKNNPFSRAILIDTATIKSIIDFIKKNFLVNGW